MYSAALNRYRLYCCGCFSSGCSDGLLSLPTVLLRAMLLQLSAADVVSVARLNRRALALVRSADATLSRAFVLRDTTRLGAIAVRCFTSSSLFIICLV